MPPQTLKSLVRYGYVPFMLIALNGAAYLAVANGLGYLWLLPLLALAFATAHIAERIIPFHEEWNHSHGGDETANAWHTVVYEGTSAVGVLMIPLVAYLLQLEPGGLIGLWPRDWPVLGQLVMAVLIADFMFTLMHWLSHRYSALWRLHAVHHGAKRIYSFNGLVRHPLHQALDMAIGTAPLALVGMPVEVAALLGFVISVQLIVQHSNVDAVLGPFRDHLSIGRIHHLHHVNWGKEGDVNFGLFLTLWDRMFGTFAPEPPRPIKATDMGVDDAPRFPSSYLEHLAFPFRYTPGQRYVPSDNSQAVMTASARAGAVQDAAE